MKLKIGDKIGDDNYQNRDHYYSIFKTVEEWQQTMVAPGADPANDGEWVSDCDECYVEQKIRDHVVDMEFVATDENGRVLDIVRSDDSDHQNFLELGFTHDVDITHTRVYSYNLKTYNIKRGWNNPEGWANPENFEKFRW